MELEGSLPYLRPSWTRSIQSMIPHPNSWRFVLILSSHLQLSGLPSGVLPSGIPQKPCMLSPISSTCPAHFILLGLIIRVLFGEEYKLQRSTLRSLLYSPVTSSLRPKYLPQHPILKHPQPMFLAQCERPSFTSRQNNRQGCNSLILTSLFLE